MNFSRTFGQIEYLFLSVFIILYLIYFVRMITAARKLKVSANSLIFKFFIRSIYVSLIFLALLGPNFGVTETEARVSGKDIFIAFDLSESMNANDVEPSRLEKAKSETLKLVENFKSDRIGVLIFNSDAFVFSPLTFDSESIKSTIQSLKTSQLKNGSTDFNPVFTLLNEKFGSSTKERAKVAVIISDGEIHFPNDNREIEKLKQNNISLFFYAVGTTAGGKVPKGSSFKKDKEGNEVLSILDIENISKFSKQTGGNYFILDNEKNDREALTEAINQVFGSTVDINSHTVTYNKYIFFLLLALVFVSIDFLITVKVLKI